MIIAVDGPAASGKGSLAARLAAHYRLPHLDTGLLYRAVGLRLRLEGLQPGDTEAAISIAESFDPAWLHHPALRDREAGAMASAVAVIPGVRKALRDFQHHFAMQEGGAVLDGRDIGTVIAPQAEVKLWVTADAAVRAGRRFRELAARGEPFTEADILADLMRRDANDAPNMVPAADAVTIDTSTMGIDAVLARALEIVEQRTRAALASGAPSP
jgi:cytidylate kinase